jgi:sialate O-acetylesterase
MLHFQTARRWAQWLLLVGLCVACSPLQAAEFKLAGVFTNDAVLQRDRPVPVWGWAEPGQEVLVEFAGQKKTGQANEHGRWMVRLDPLAASAEPRDLKAGDRVLHNVLVGDVWLCAGQSNMAMTVDGQTAWLRIGGIADAKAVVRDSANPLVRQFSVDWKTDTKPQDDCTGTWTVAGPDTTANFSATGYFFARELQRRLQVPIAILNASFGGSSVEGWTSQEALAQEADPEFVAQMNRLLDDYENHDQLMSRYASAVAAWEAKHARADPDGASNDDRRADLQIDAASWKPITLPASLAQHGCPDGGVVWLRREIEVPAEFGNAWRLDFPACRAFVTIYLNGRKIFEATPTNGLAGRPSRPTPTREAARVGKNTLVIKLHAYSGTGGITGGPFSIVPFNPKFSAVPLAGPWQFQVEKQFAPLPQNAPAPPAAPVKGTLHWMPVPSQYNAMLHPLVPYAIRGAAWYQGESNVGNSRYARHLQILIRDWRRRWGQGDFPFYLCQLPGFGPPQAAPQESTWAACREMQMAALMQPNTGIANLIDTCEDGDLHPLNKQDVGDRLARIALANTYGVTDVAWSGPVFDTMKIDGGKAIIHFKHADGGLSARTLPATYRPNLRKPELPPKPLELPSPGSELQGFTICDASQRWVNAQAKIDGSTVVVWSDDVADPIAVRYAWADHPICNLYNRAGLPAFPFRTDDFALPDTTKK